MILRKVKTAAAVIATVSAAGLGCAQAPERQAGSAADSKAAARERNKAAVAKIERENVEKHGKNPDMLVKPGLLANRKAKRVAFWAESTGLGANGHPPEFFVIAENSGHDYEALAVSFARPSDLHDALRFIGMEPGRRVDFEKLRFWPKGERVFMSISHQDANGNQVGPFRMEKLFLDKKTGKPLEETGLVFTGSDFVEMKEAPGKKAYAADVYDPNSIASNYNEPTTVLDVPRPAHQKETYNNLAVNPAMGLPEKALLAITIEPEYKDEKRRVIDLTLAVAARDGARVSELGQVKFTLTGKDGKTVAATNDLNGVLAAFAALAKDGRDPFVMLKPDGGLSVKVLRDTCAALALIDTEKGVRMEPPSSNDLYYRAFAPDSSFKDRAARFAQPWELRLGKKDAQVSGVLTQIKQTWNEGEIKPELTATNFMVADAPALRKTLNEKGPGLRVILVFATPTLTYRELLDFLALARATHPLIHVFVEEKDNVTTQVPARSGRAPEGIG
ncbi:MAG: YdjY domain-containing protein, partial [Verrucomicrobiota bacterium]|nr:YdjY domain-containing protein [Verrucomicrobiota bacterium]